MRLQEFQTDEEPSVTGNLDDVRNAALTFESMC